MVVNMMRLLSGVILLIILTLNPLNTSAQIIIPMDSPTVETSKLSNGKWTLPYVSAHSAILMDFETGDILYHRDEHTKRPPASTTKILTAVIALELAELDEIAVVSEEADKVGESSLYLKKGEKIKLGELIEGALIKSGNDACVAIAEQTAGSVNDFVRLMNIKAVSIGAKNSNFTNPHGLPDKNHYSTAYDLAVITRYALKIPEFSRIVEKKVTTINYQEPLKSRVYNNTNKLLWSYPFADGVKTGTTNSAGKCLVASASKEGRKLICVLLNAPDRFGDARRLLEWGFNNTEIVLMGKKGDNITRHPASTKNLPVVLGENAEFCIEKNATDDLRIQIEFVKDISLPIRKGDIVGSYNIYQGEKLIKTVPLLSDQESIGNPLDFSGTLNYVVDQFLQLLKKG